jgi:16S rRNA (cytosine1402-N4)-methyltransferase
LHNGCVEIARFLQPCDTIMIAPPAVVAFSHAAVLVEAVSQSLTQALASRDHAVYVDGTVGGAGHAAALLARAPGASLIGIDRDPAALAASEAVLAPMGERVGLVHGDYAELPRILAERGVAKVDGILLDLGVSSPQLDAAERGFSFTRPGPIDMRMNPTAGLTALDLLRATPVAELGELIGTLGEERHAKKIARRIKEALAAERLHTTVDLARVIAEVIPAIEQRKSKIHPATRTFQALRIAVNEEIEQLERFLDVFPDLLAPGGRCAIISFHSLEDRLVKNRFRDLAWTSSLPARLAERAGERVAPVCELVTRKAIVASDEEIAANPRARSARLRVCQRTEARNAPSGNPLPSHDRA